MSPALDYKFVVNSVDPDEAISPSKKEKEPDLVPASNRSRNVVPERDEDEDDAEEDADSRVPLILAENGTLANSTGNHQQGCSFWKLTSPSGFVLDASVVIIGDANAHTQRKTEEPDRRTKRSSCSKTMQCVAKLISRRCPQAGRTFQSNFLPAFSSR